MEDWVAHAAALEDDTSEGGAAADRAYARMKDLLDLAERLPARRENLNTKMLALAWVMHVDLWERDRPRDDYATDGRLAFDIHAIVSAEPVDESGPAEDADEPLTLENAAPMHFEAYAFDEPVKSPNGWVSEFAPHSMGLHVADRTLRMTKAELVAFIRLGHDKDPTTPQALYNALEIARDTIEGWGKLLEVARCRYLVAASAFAAEEDARHVQGEAV